MEGGETVRRIYGMRQESIFNEKKKSYQCSENSHVLPTSHGSDCKYRLGMFGCNV